MKMTMETDYAVRILYCLAKASTRLDAKTISEQMCVTLRFSLKILRKLVQGGIVTSFKGVNGGYELAKPPQEITLADVVRAVDGEIEINRCLSPNVGCNRLKNKNVCQFRREFQKINDTLNREFESVTLAHFIK